MTRIRILHVVNCFRPAGTELVVLRLIQGLDPELFEQTVCSVYDPAPELERLARTVRLGATPGKFQIVIGKLAKLMRELHPDIVHARNSGAIEAVFAARLAGVPAVIFSEHGRNLDTAMSIPAKQKWTRAAAYSMATTVFGVSRELQDFYQAQVGFPARKFKVVKNGVDTVRFAPNSITRCTVRESLKIADDRMIIGAVGRLDPIKGHAVLLQAAELLQKRAVRFLLLLIGDGPERPKLQAMVDHSSALRDHVLFVGEVADVPAWLNALDIMVLASLSEGMSNTLLEGMATGLASVATTVGSNSEIVVHERTGMLVPPANAERLADALLKLHSDPQLGASLGRTARQEIIQNYSLGKMLTNYQDLYLDSLRDSRSGRKILAGTAEPLQQKRAMISLGGA